MNSKKKISLIFSLIVLAFISFSILFFHAVLGSAEEAIPSTQTYGTNYELPTRNIIVDDETLPAKTYLYMPDGKVVTEKTVLNQYGKYTLEFVAEKDGIEHKDYEYFNVNYPVITAQGNGSYTEYVVGDGLYVTSRINYPLVFNNILNVSDMNLDNPLVTVHVRPAVIGFAELDKMTITLTDVYDPSNFITIVARPHSSNKAYNTYFNVAAPGQLLKGQDRDGSYHINNDYGTPSFMTYSGETSEVLGQVGGFSNITDNFSLYFDYQNKAVYVSNNSERPIDTIADLDDDAIQETVWNGFTSDKVKMTITLSDGSMATLLFSEVLGTDLSATDIVDVTAPIVSVDLPDQIPVAEQGKAYKLFSSSAIDDHESVLDTTISVSFDNGVTEVPVVVKNNSFIPVGEGVHKVTYSATDKFGNVGTKVVEIYAEESLDPIEILVQGKQAEGRISDWLDIEQVSVNGGSGVKEVSLKVLYNDGTVSGILDGYRFKPYKSGKYNAIYYATDYLGNVGVLVNSFNVNSITDPVFENYDYLPLAMMEGFRYELPNVIATDYADDMKEIVCKIRVTDASKDKVILDTNTYYPQVENDGDKVLIEYIAYGKEGTVIKSFEPAVYSVKDGNNIAPEKYFNIINSASVSVGDGVATLTATSDSTITYINPVLFKLFKTSFRVNGNVKTVKVLLTDSGDASNGFYVAFTQTSTGVVVNIDGQATFETDYTFDGKNKEISVGYDITEDKISIGGTLYSVPEMPSFRSDKIFVSYQFIGVNASTDISLISLNSHTFYNDNYDYDNPEIYFDPTLGGNRAINTKIKTAVAVMGDVTDSYVRGTVSVKAPSGDYVKDVNGVEIKNLSADVSYEFVLDKYGKYTVTYNLRDSSQNRVTPPYTITVQDDVPPVISVNKLAETGTVGKTIKIESATAYDNLDGNLPVYLTVIDPNMIYQHVKISDGSYNFTKAGVYQFVYYSVDQEFNISKVIFNVEVK